VKGLQLHRKHVATQIIVLNLSTS